MVDTDGHCSTLPPKVLGPIFGYVNVKVAPIIWTRRKDSPVKIKVHWWGQDYAEFTFRIGSKKNEKLLHTYPIHTTLPLFRGYLTNSQVTLSVIDEQMGTIIGNCVISELNSIIHETPHELYHPILNEFKSLIGNIPITFQLITKSKSSTSESDSVTTRTTSTNFKIDELHLSDSENCLNNKIVQKVLNQGQRLRNAMVETIIDNDPLNKEVYINKSTQRTTKSEDFNRNVQDEQFILDTIRTISPPASCIHQKVDESEPPQEKLSKKFEYLIKPGLIPDCPFLQYVDSVKIYIHTLILNATGWRKLAGTDTNTSFRPPTFFIEYTIPQILTQGVNPNESRVTVNIRNFQRNNNNVRLCSRKVIKQVVQFKQQTIHRTGNIEYLNLSNIFMEFKVHSRSVSQRGSVPIGIAKYNLYDVMTQSNLSCDEELALLDTNKPLTIGSLKVRIQFGCDKLHFGKDFIDAISSEKKNRRLSGSSDSILEEKVTNKKRDSIDRSKSAHQIKDNRTSSTERLIKKQVEARRITSRSITSRTVDTQRTTPRIVEIHQNTPRDSWLPFDTPTTPKLLRGLIYIPEIKFDSDEENSSFIVCRAFWREDMSKSKICRHTQRAVINFFEVVPILYDSDFLVRTKNNFLVVEVWKYCVGKNNTLIGICKLPLHQFYIAYRDPRVAANLVESKFPVISFDGWDDVIHPITLTRSASIHALVAVGTEDQLLFLEQSRGINRPSCVPPETSSFLYYHDLDPTKIYPSHDHPTEVPSKQYPVVEPEIPPHSVKTFPETPSLLSFDLGNKPIEKVDKEQQTIESRATQTSPIKMDSSTDTPEDKSDKTLTRDNLLATFMELASQKEEVKPVEEKPVQPAPLLQETSKLLDKLQIALREPPPSNVNLHSLKNIDLMKKPSKHTTDQLVKNEDNTKTFKSHILIENAVRLALRRRRIKTGKTKNVKKENEILPSTYVTFEPIAGKGLIFTKVVHKSSNPKWNQHFECNLPIDLLYDEQKRLIFKVWSKTKNDSEPNVISDTVIGFAALDLTVLNSLSTIHAWFNISDFSSRCNGQIKINVTPLEDISKYSADLSTEISAESSVTDLLEEIVPSTSPSLSNTLKRKFSELDEITARLKQRLMTVTTDDDNKSDRSEDLEFEFDLNTEPSCHEDADDFDFTKLEAVGTSQERQNMNQFLSGISTADSGFTDTFPHSTNKGNESPPKLSISEIDFRLKQNKMQFDTLFERLTLHSQQFNNIEDFPIDKSGILEDITEESEPKSKEIIPESSTSSSGEDRVDHKLIELTTDSDTSFDFNSETLLLNREGPEGAGNPSTEKS